MSEDGKKRLKDLAKQVRDKATVSGSTLLHQKGLELLDDLAKELTAPDGMPGLRVWRDGVTRLRLQRSPRNAEISIEWQREIGAAAMTSEKHGEPKKTVRYIWDESLAKWRRFEGGGEIYEDLTASLVEYLYPEGK